MLLACATMSSRGHGPLDVGAHGSRVRRTLGVRALACLSLSALSFVGVTCAREPSSEPLEGEGGGAAAASALVSAGSTVEAQGAHERAATLALERARSLFPGALRDGEASELVRLAGSLRPRFDDDAPYVAVGRKSDVAVSLSARQGEPTVVRHTRRALAVSYTLQGASPSEAVVSDGLVVYPEALGAGATVLTRPFAGGVEDYVLFAERPHEERLRYTLELDHVAGVRLVGNVLELLDEGGHASLHVSPPWVEGLESSSRAVRREARLSLEGCPVDTDVRVPHRREFVRLPRVTSAVCTLVVDWSGLGVGYPALVDPEWKTAGAMTRLRYQHSATLLATGDVLIAGGLDPTTGNVTSATELFDPVAEVFTTGPAMKQARAGHTETRLDTPGSPPTPTNVVLLVGGHTQAGGAGPLLRSTTAELFDGTDFSLGNVAAPATVVGLEGRVGHTATFLGLTGQVLVAGGSDTVPGTARVYTPNVNPLLVGTFGPPINMVVPRRHHAAELVLDGTDRVLVAGGIGPSFVESSAELYSPATGTFTALAGSMTAPRAFATATRLEDLTGSIVIAGGSSTQSPVPGNLISKTADVFNPATLQFAQQPKTMAERHAKHTATKLVGEGKVLFAGGVGEATPETTEIDVYDVSLSGFDLQLSAPMTYARSEHAAARLLSGTVLVTGGLGANSASAELLLRQNGEPCDAAGECASGFCTTQEPNPVCCNEPCQGLCFTCASSAGECTPSPFGEDVTAACVSTGDGLFAEVQLQCNGNGGVTAAQAQNCNTYGCGQNGECGTACLTHDDCSKTGYCEEGLCKPRVPKGTPLGAACKLTSPPAPLSADGSNCAEGLFCVDGTCCTSACAGQCEACGLPESDGDCVPVQGEPVGSKPACDTDGSSCGGSCDGVTTGTCTYPTSDCSPNICSQGQEVKGTCAAGACTTEDVPCFPFVCNGGGTGCTASCDDAGDCGDGAICSAEGTCLAVQNALCDLDHTIVNPDGSTKDCTPYLCSASTNDCLASCQSLDDCVAPSICVPGPSGQGLCQPAPPAPAPPTDCAASPTKVDDRAGSLAAAVLVALALAARSRRGPRPRSTGGRAAAPRPSCGRGGAS
jgi:hypothetical protein